VKLRSGGRSPSSRIGMRARRADGKTAAVWRAVQIGGVVTARKKPAGLRRRTGMELGTQCAGFRSARRCCNLITAVTASNLLDTPGHKDFSEDTYRVLTAVDAVVMVIDAGKGIEAQTRKLFGRVPDAADADFHLHEQVRPANAGTLALFG